MKECPCLSLKAPNLSFLAWVGLSSVCTVSLCNSLEVNCVHLEIQSYFKGFFCPSLCQNGTIRDFIHLLNSNGSVVAANKDTKEINRWGGHRMKAQHVKEFLKLPICLLLTNCSWSSSSVFKPHSSFFAGDGYKIKDHVTRASICETEREI